MVRYTVVMANYNMSQTIGQAIESVHRLTDEQFEILVIDDGSTDDSVEVIKQLQQDLSRVRLIQDSKPYLNEVRASAVEYANGEYLLHQLDADDEYECCILDFVEIFHQIEEQVDFDPFLSGNHIHIGSKSLFQNTNYRHLGYNGDRDLWRRMICNGSFIGLHHKGIASTIGYRRSLFQKIPTRFEAIVTQFRSGISVTSYFLWLLTKLLQWRPSQGAELSAILFNIISTPFAFLMAERQGRYNVHNELSNMFNAESMLESNKMTLTAIEARYNITIDRSRLSKRGRDVYDINANDHPRPRYYLGERADIS